MVGKIARLDICRAELLGKFLLLRDTKWRHLTLQNSVVKGVQDIMHRFNVLFPSMGEQTKALKTINSKIDM